jgi:hypothetical protein
MPWILAQRIVTRMGRDAISGSGRSLERGPQSGCAKNAALPAYVKCINRNRIVVGLQLKLWHPSS